jgi:GntR family histidine utilization transcriptional repressor
MSDNQNKNKLITPDKLAKYTIIKQFIRENIESGKWPQNARVPQKTN